MSRAMLDTRWRLVYVVQESTSRRDGLSVHMDVCATLEAAMQVADERAGRFVGAADPWRRDGTLTSIEYHSYERRVLDDLWQHINTRSLNGEPPPPCHPNCQRHGKSPCEGIGCRGEEL